MDSRIWYQLSEESKLTYLQMLGKVQVVFGDRVHEVSWADQIKKIRTRTGPLQKRKKLPFLP